MAQDTTLAQDAVEPCPAWAISALRLGMGRMAEALEKARTPEELVAIRQLARERIHELAALQGVDPVVRGEVLQAPEKLEAEPSVGLLSGLAAATCHCRNLRPQAATVAK